MLINTRKPKFIQKTFGGDNFFEWLEIIWKKSVKKKKSILNVDRPNYGLKKKKEVKFVPT